jgi:glc operon protein GlcG
MYPMNDSCADQVVSAALSAARADGATVSIAVLDAGGQLRRFHRSSGAAAASAGMAEAKAWTSVAFAADTHTLADLPPLAGAFRRPIAQLPGGVRLLLDGEVIGGVGVGGASPDEDLRIARAGAAALG